MTPHVDANTAFEGANRTEPLVPPTATPLDGAEIMTWTRELSASGDNNASTGFWEASVGRSYWVFEDYTEVIYIIGGRLVATEEGEVPIELTAGDVAVFPKGWKGEWNVTETLKKFYAVHP